MLLIATHTVMKILKDLRLSLLLASILLSLGISGIFSSEEVIQERELASRRALQAEHRSDLDRALLVKPYNQLAFAHQGVEKELPQHLVIAPRLSDYARQDVSLRELSPSARSFDWTFVLKYVISIVCLLISFDLICGESEHGTLRVLLTMGANRRDYFAGSYIGSLFALLPAFLIGFLLSLTIVALRTGLTLDTAMITVLAGMLLAALSLCAAFVGLGLLASSLATRSSSSLLLALTFWVCLVFLIPNLAGLLADHFRPVPSVQAWEADLANAHTRFLARLYPLSGGEITRIASRPDLSEAQKKTEIEELQQSIDEQNEVAMDAFVQDIVKLRSRFLQALSAQAELADFLAMVSPMAAYEQVAEALTGTGMQGQRRFLRLAERYRRTFEDYADPIRQERRSEARRIGATITSGDFSIQNVQRISYAGLQLDRSGYPRLHFPPPDLSEVAESAGLAWSVLLASLALITASGFVAFLRFPL